MVKEMTILMLDMVGNMKEDCNEDNNGYIKSTVAVDILPYIGKPVQHWPMICAKGTKKTPLLSLS